MNSSDNFSYQPKDKKQLTDDDTKKIDNIIKRNEDRLRLKRLDEANPHEQAEKFRMIKQNPPNPDFMKVEVYKGTDETGTERVFSKSTGFDGRPQWLEHDPFFVFSPYIGFMSNINKAPLNVVPMLLDEAMNVVAEEKKAFKPEKRKDESNWSWVLFLLLCIGGTIGAIAFLAMRFMGGA